MFPSRTVGPITGCVHGSTDRFELNSGIKCDGGFDDTAYEQVRIRPNSQQNSPGSRTIVALGSPSISGSQINESDKLSDTVSRLASRFFPLTSPSAVIAEHMQRPPKMKKLDFRQPEIKCDVSNHNLVLYDMY